MILRRLAQGIRQQDWFVVGVEILTVVVGIFIGLQVDDWNEARRDKEEEARILVRLHDDLMAIEPRIHFEFAKRDQLQNSLWELVELLKENNQTTQLTPDQCRAVLYSHRYAAPIVPIPVIIEIMASGDIGLIHHSSIRTAITNVIIAQDNRVNLMKDIQSQRSILSNEYPDLIRFSNDLEDLASSTEAKHQCNLVEMRKNQGFINKLLDNSARYRGHWRTSLDEVDAVAQLHQNLDRALHIDHGGDRP